MSSLKCMFFDKWLHKGQISQEEYDAVIKKLDGHDKQIRADAEREFQNSDYWNDYLAKVIADAKAEAIDDLRVWLAEKKVEINTI